MKMRYLPALLLCSVLLPAQQSSRTYLKMKGADGRQLPLSRGVLVGKTLYISGAIGIPPAGQKVTAEEEARLAMDQMKQVVHDAGMTMGDVVSVQVFSTDMTSYDAFNNVYKTYFKDNYPARAFVGVANLVLGARYEVMGIAVKGRD